MPDVSPQAAKAARLAVERADAGDLDGAAAALRSALEIEPTSDSLRSALDATETALDALQQDDQVDFDLEEILADHGVVVRAHDAESSEDALLGDDADFADDIFGLSASQEEADPDATNPGGGPEDDYDSISEESASLGEQLAQLVSDSVSGNRPAARGRPGSLAGDADAADTVPTFDFDDMELDDGGDAAAPSPPPRGRPRAGTGGARYQAEAPPPPTHRRRSSPEPAGAEPAARPEAESHDDLDDLFAEFQPDRAVVDPDEIRDDESKPGDESEVLELTDAVESQIDVRAQSWRVEDEAEEVEDDFAAFMGAIEDATGVEQADGAGGDDWGADDSPIEMESEINLDSFDTREVTVDPEAAADFESEEPSVQQERREAWSFDVDALVSGEVEQVDETATAELPERGGSDQAVTREAGLVDETVDIADDSFEDSLDDSFAIATGTPDEDEVLYGAAPDDVPTAPPPDLGGGGEIGDTLDVDVHDAYSGAHDSAGSGPVPEEAAEPEVRARPDLADKQDDSVRTLLEIGQQLFASEKREAALEIAERVLVLDPGNAEAQKLARACQADLAVVEAEAAADAVGAEEGSGVLRGRRRQPMATDSAPMVRMDHVPRLSVAPSELVELELDHRLGFLVSQIDGTVTLADLVDLSGMPPDEARRAIAELIRRGVIEMAE